MSLIANSGGLSHHLWTPDNVIKSYRTRDLLIVYLYSIPTNVGTSRPIVGRVTSYHQAKDFLDLRLRNQNLRFSSAPTPLIFTIQFNPTPSSTNDEAPLLPFRRRPRGPCLC